MNVIPIPALKDNYIWCIVHPNNQQCVIIDPGAAEPVFSFLKQQQLQLAAILVTHHHWDHTGGIQELVETLKVPVYGGMHEKPIPQCQNRLDDGQQFTLPKMNIALTALAIPGHTLGHTAYYGNGVVFTGDTLFTGGCGRIFEGTPAMMYQSLQKLAALPEETLIYCGHEYTQANLQFALKVEPTNTALLERIETTHQLRLKNLPTVPATLKLEKQTNPFLRVDQPTIIKAVENHISHSLPTPVEIFAALRDWKNNF